MSATSQQRSAEFLKIAGQFKLGALVTEASHPVTDHLSDAAKRDVAAALKLLFDVDADVVGKFRALVESGHAEEIARTVLSAVQNGGRIFFTGCGATGRLSILLDSIWRGFWRRRGKADWENRTFSVMAGGDYALIKSVEGFEDFVAFGKKQIGDLGISGRDVVFAITEGGETSFVIGTAWAGVEAGAKVYFVYNNPDDILCEHVQRSREVIQDGRVENINLTTGPMAITGSTRMQATSIQLCVLLAVLEMVVRELTGGGGIPAADVPQIFLRHLEQLLDTLRSPAVLAPLGQLVVLEEAIYRAGRRNNYFAGALAVDVLTDTTERSPTFCTPPFRKFDAAAASESWAFLLLPPPATPEAWRHLLQRAPRCLDWSAAAVRDLVPEDRRARTLDILGKITLPELLRFHIGLEGLADRPPRAGDGAVAVAGEGERNLLVSPDGFYRAQLEAARKSGAGTGLIYFGREKPPGEIPDCLSVFVPLPHTDLLLDGLTRVAAKLVLNALSTCTMVRLGRVMGNCMVWVVPSNLKLIDRATRYIVQLAGLDYEAANALLFDIIEFVEPRMKRDQAYPPVVGMAVLRARHGLSNEQAEAKLREGL